MATHCIEETGRTLDINNQGIVKYLCTIEEERNNLETIIQRQYQERKKIEAEIEKLTYKLCLINKSLSMRIKAKNNYDKTIDEIKSHYEKLVVSSSTLREIVEKTQQELDDIMNKKIGTGGPSGEEIKMLYIKQSGSPDPDHCPCSYVPETPTKENENNVTSSPGFSNAPPNSPSSDTSFKKRSSKQSKDERYDKAPFGFPPVDERENLSEDDIPNVAETSPPEIELPEQSVSPPQKDEDQSQTKQPNKSSANQPITDGRSGDVTNKRRPSADVIENEKEIASISAENGMNMST